MEPNLQENKAAFEKQKQAGLRRKKSSCGMVRRAHTFELLAKQGLGLLHGLRFVKKTFNVGLFELISILAVSLAFL